MYTSPEGNRCHLVAIEGPDRVGKATQATMLRDSLVARGMKAIVEEIPYDDGVTHAEIYRMLREGEAMKYPEVFQWLQGMNRRIFQKIRLSSLASEYDVVVLDRWNLSTRVYGGCDGVSERTTENILRRVVEPDVYLVFDADPFPKENLDSYEKDLEFQRRVRREYLSWCEKDPQRFVKIDAGRPLDEVHHDVLEVVNALLR
jgi:dTMP kinase